MIKWQKIIAGTMMAMMLAMSFSAVLVAPVSAASSTITVETLGLEYAEATGLGNTDVRVTASKIIRVAMGLLGIIAVVLVLYGGFLWMTAGGNDDKVVEAKKWIFGGIIGLAIILSAYAIASFVINQLVSATTGAAIP